MRRNVFYSRIWRQRWRYGLVLSLVLCVLTVIFSLVFLDESPRLPSLPRHSHALLAGPVSRLELQAKNLPFPPDKAVGGGGGVGGLDGGAGGPAGRAKGEKVAEGSHDVKILNDIEIEVGNSSMDGGAAPLVLSSLGKGSFNFPVKEGGRRHRFPVEGDILAKNGVAFLNSSLSLSSSSSSSSMRQRWIIYLCHANMTCCGWGDRQHGILSAYVIAQVTNRTFGVDMTSPCPLTTFLHPRRLDWRVNHTALQGRSTKYIYSVNDKIFRQLMGRIDFDAVYPQDVVYLTTNYDYFYPLKNNPHYRRVFRQRMRGRPRPVVFAELFQNSFKLNKRVKRRLASALEVARPTPSHKLVCAHVRLGKNPTIPWDSEQRNTMTSIAVLWQFFSQYRDPNLYRVFVASDSEMVRQRAAELFPGQIVDVEGEIIHIDKLHGAVDACAGFEKVIADQALLATCDVLVLTYSVFGKSAAYMRRRNENLYYMENGVISPLRLFKT